MTSTPTTPAATADIPFTGRFDQVATGVTATGEQIAIVREGYWISVLVGSRTHQNVEAVACGGVEEARARFASTVAETFPAATHPAEFAFGMSLEEAAARADEIRIGTTALGNPYVFGRIDSGVEGAAGLGVYCHDHPTAEHARTFMDTTIGQLTTAPGRC